jgi:GNAT superfamily N-acetyltransferase
MSGGMGENTGSEGGSWSGRDRIGISERIDPVDGPSPPWSAAHSVRREPSAGDGPRLIIARAVEELLARYGNVSSYELELDSSTFDPPRGAFLVARARGLDGDPVGGVGVRRIHPDGRDDDDRRHGGSEGHSGPRGLVSTAEVRRLWVDPARRGRGIARSLMNALEHEAVALGCRSLELVTGERQPEAVALYESGGWARNQLDRDARPLPAGVIRFTKLIA